MKRCHASLAGLLVAAIVGAPAHVRAEASRLKELVTVDGYRSNQLTGIGLVVGLAGSGDNAQSPITKKAIANALKRHGMQVSPADIKAKNVAVVMVTSELLPFARTGMRIDVTVSSIGEANSLQGGTLLSSPLQGFDGRVYAVAAGPVSLGGFAVTGETGTETRKNHTTVGRIPTGAVVEYDAPTSLSRDEVVLLLKDPDFTTATRISQAIDATFSAKVSQVPDPGSVRVRIAPEWRKRTVEFISLIESIEAVPDAPARVVIDERTGTVVVGQFVRIGKVAVAHGALTVTVRESEQASQPGILAKAGETVVTKRSEVEIEEQPGDLQIIEQAATVNDVAAGLNALGAKPRDLVSIFQALKAAGALRAEIFVL